MDYKQEAEKIVETKEVWNNIPGYDGMYKASNLGNIKSLYGKNEKLIKPVLRLGYYTVSLYVNRIGKIYRIHRLVATSFLGESTLHVDHINGNKLDNRLCNLRYVTARFNTSFGYKKNKVNCTSKYPGVYYLKANDKWRSITWHNNKRVSIGCYSTEIEAYEAYVKYVSNNCNLSLTN